MKEKITKFLKGTFTKQYLIYHFRWQVSAVVMFPVMGFLQMIGYPLIINLLIGQFFGAVVFYKIDDLIFKKEEVLETTEETTLEPSVSERKL